jgi:hypothetical protein
MKDLKQNDFLKRKGKRQMKKLLPTLLPILGLAITAISPDVQAAISHFVSQHTALSGLFSVIGLIVNHWLPSPKSTPSDSTVAKIGTSMLCITLILSTFFTTGCSQSEVVNAMQKVDTGLKIAKGVLPQASLILQELQQVDPEAAEYFAPVLQKSGPALDKLIAAAEAYISNPGNDAYQAVLNGVDAFTAQVDQVALGTVGIKNPQSQAKVVGWIALFSTGLHVTLGILDSYATSKQKKAVPAVSARVSFDQIHPFLNRSYARAELDQMGYSHPDQLLAYAGL